MQNTVRGGHAHSAGPPPVRHSVNDPKPAFFHVKVRLEIRLRKSAVSVSVWEAFWGHFSTFFTPGAVLDIKNGIFRKCVFSLGGSTILKDNSA